MNQCRNHPKPLLEKEGLIHNKISPSFSKKGPGDDLNKILF